LIKALLETKVGFFEPRCSLKMGPVEDLVAVKKAKRVRSFTISVGQTIEISEWVCLEFTQISNERVARRLGNGNRFSHCFVCMKKVEDVGWMEESFS
jgi:hypothetical protein